MIFRTALVTAGLFVACGAAQAQRPDARTIVVGFGTEAQTLEPAQINSRDTQNIADHIWGSLFEIADDGHVTPYLAQSAAESEDGTSITFTLKPNLTCHDGSKLTADDVAFTFDRARDPANKFTGSMPGFVLTSLGYKGVRVLDAQTVAIDLAAYNPIALGLITEAKIVCRAPYSKMSLEQASQTPVGTGPYRFVEWIKSDHITIEKQPGFSPKAAQFDRIVWRVVPEASTRAAELMAGNLDVVTSVSPDQIALVNASAKARVQSVAGTRRIYVGFQQRPIFDTPGAAAIRKPEVRRALQYAIDVPTICEQLLGTPCQRATDLVNPPLGNPDLKPYPYEPATAERLLDEAGYKADASGVRFTLRLQSPSGRYLNDKNVALAIGQYLSDIGVKTDVEFLDWASVYLPLVRKRDAGPLFLLGTGGGTWNALYDMADFATPESVTNEPAWTDRRWFDAWPLANRKQPEAQRQAIINGMLKVFHEDGPWLELYFQPDFYGVSNRLNWQARRDERIDLTGATLK